MQLPEPAKEAPHVALLLVCLLRHLEKTPHPRKRRSLLVLEAGIEACMDLRYVGVDDLQRKILLVREVMVEGALGSSRGGEQGLDAQVVVALLQKHEEAGLDQALLG